MAGIDRQKLQQDIANAMNQDGFNLYSFLKKYN
jgi:hypothetical protein